MRHISFLIAAAFAAPCLAQPAATSPWVTGERLVKLMGTTDPLTVEWTPASPYQNRTLANEHQDIVNGEFVHGYIQAVHDASEGRNWCWSQYKPKPHELVDDARRSLQQMDRAQLKRNAAELIVEVWRARFPCPAVVPADRAGAG